MKIRDNAVEFVFKLFIVACLLALVYKMLSDSNDPFSWMFLVRFMLVIIALIFLLVGIARETKAIILGVKGFTVVRPFLIFTFLTWKEQTFNTRQILRMELDIQKHRWYCKVITHGGDIHKFSVKSSFKLMNQLSDYCTDQGIEFIPKKYGERLKLK